MKTSEFQLMIRKIIREELVMAMDEIKSLLLEGNTPSSSNKITIKENKTPISSEIRSQFRESLKNKMLEDDFTHPPTPVNMNINATQPEQVGEVDVNFIMNNFLKK
jgi:hypothetical protein